MSVIDSPIATSPLWRELVQAELDKGRSIVAIAKDLGYARSSISLALAGKYVGSPQRIYDRIVEVYGSVQCPYFEKSIRRGECTAYSQREAPTHNPNAMKHWRMCQGCPNKCEV